MYLGSAFQQCTQPILYTFVSIHHCYLDYQALQADYFFYSLIIAFSKESSFRFAYVNKTTEKHITPV